MERKNKFMWGGVLAVGLLVVLGSYFLTDKTAAQTVGGIRLFFDGTAVDFAKEVVSLKGILDLTESDGVDEPSLGANSGPDSFSDVECHNGICYGFVSTALAATSSTICILPNPLGATSTIKRTSLSIFENPFGAQVLYVSTSTDARASAGSTINGSLTGTSSPSLVDARLIGAAEKAAIVWEPLLWATTTEDGTASLGTVGRVFTDSRPDRTAGGANTNDLPFIIGADEVIAFTFATDTPGVFGSYITGQCQAEFVSLGGK